MRCEEIMKAKPVCVEHDDTVAEAARRMRDQNVGCLPVCDGGRVVGVVTDRDIALRCVAEGRSTDDPIAQVMTRQVVACRPDDDVRRAEQLMGQAQKSRMLVTDARGQLLGVISLSDIARHDDDDENVARTMREVTEREIHS